MLNPSDTAWWAGNPTGTEFTDFNYGHRYKLLIDSGGRHMVTDRSEEMARLATSNHTNEQMLSIWNEGWQNVELVKMKKGLKKSRGMAESRISATEPSNEKDSYIDWLHTPRRKQRTYLGVTYFTMGHSVAS